MKGPRVRDRFFSEKILRRVFDEQKARKGTSHEYLDRYRNHCGLDSTAGLYSPKVRDLNLIETQLSGRQR